MMKLKEPLYLYENHMGGLYTSKEKYSYDDLYCETCGDSDTCLGKFKTIKEFWNLAKDLYYSIEHLFVCVVNIFELPDTLVYDDEQYKISEICCNSKRYINDRMKELLGGDFEWDKESWGEIE